MKNFVNLHTHSHYSLLDGLPQIPDLVRHAKSLDMPALALTDHGVMYGAIEFYKACRKADIKPIIGVEAYLALEHRGRKQSRLDDDYFHLILLAKDRDGYKNLMKLTSIAHLEGFYYKPRIDKESLRQHAKGLIALTGCLGGEIPRAILDNKPPSEAENILREYLDIFGQGNVFLEVQAHPEINEQSRVNQVLKDLSARTGVPRVATLDCHYLLPEDAEAQDALVCVQSGKLVSEGDRLDMRGIDLSLRSPEEVYKKFEADLAPVEESLKIAEKCNLELDLGKRFFPSFELPEGKSADECLKEMTYAGLQKRYQNAELSQEIKDRVQYELNVIGSKGYSTYFLVVADFVNWMRQQGIITNTRGSAAGCMVSYCIGIIDVNPMFFDLPFERFLNPSRPSPPDIDVDIADNRRNEVIKYVSEKYGADKVAQIITFGTMLARAAVRDIGRVLGVPYAKCDQLAKLIPPPRQGFPMPISRALETIPQLRQLYESDPETRHIIDLVRKVEGCARHASVHAAGVVISPTAMTDYTPIQHDVDGQGAVTQYDMHILEEDVGLVKIDFLGLRNLSILGNALEIIEKKHDLKIDLLKIPLDDPKTFDLLAKGETIGVFQLGGSGITTYLKELKPTTIFDIAAMIALYRPGPMQFIPQYLARKHNPKLIKYLDPTLEKILHRSYGILIYQDDLLTIAHELAGYTWEEVDKFRYAVGKKIPTEMALQKVKFIEGCIKTSGFSRQKAEEIWAWIEPFAAYGFNKAHSASYAMVCYQTAYLKANFPAEYMAAVLTAEMHDLETVAEAVEECKKMGISVLPPDINESFKMFAVIDPEPVEGLQGPSYESTQTPQVRSGASAIRWALTAVKNVGHDVVAEIVRERKENGPFSSFQNFVNRLPIRALNRKALESLICSGAFDSLTERNMLLANLESILESARNAKRSLAEGQSSLFGKSAAPTDNSVKNFTLQPAAPATTEQKLTWEKELLGLYISAHPLEDSKDLLAKLTPIKNIASLKEGAHVAIGGVISKIHKITTRKGEPMAFVTLEDLTGLIETICFPRLYTASLALFESSPRLIAVGKISDKDGENKIILDQLLELTEENLAKVKLNGNGYSRNYASKPDPKPAPAAEPQRIAINIPLSASQQIFTDLKNAFESYPGEAQVVLMIPDGRGEARQVATKYRVSATDRLKDQVKEIIKNHANPQN